MVRLVSLRSEVDEDALFGTCDLCFHTGSQDIEFFVFENENEERHEIETGYWEWGDYVPYYHVDNIFNFADFIESKVIKTFEELNDKFDGYYHEYIYEIEEATE